MDYSAFLDRIEMCHEGKQVFAKLHSRWEEPGFSALVQEGYAAYDRGDEDFAAFIAQFAARQEVTPEEANLYMYLHICRRTYEIYREKGIEDQVFYETMKAFARHCEVCCKKYGSYGIAQRVYRAWYRRQLNGVLFRLGRLEFEIVSSNYQVTLDGHSLQKGDPCISVHIPGGSSLDIAECEAAYDQARTFFAEKFGITRCFFFCASWLMHPWLTEDLPASSRIVQFQKKYAHVEILQDEAIVRDWLFDNSQAPYEELPVKTSLHKAAVYRLQKGLPIGQARSFRL